MANFNRSFFFASLFVFFGGLIFQPLDFLFSERFARSRALFLYLIHIYIIIILLLYRALKSPGMACSVEVVFRHLRRLIPTFLLITQLITQIFVENPFFQQKLKVFNIGLKRSVIVRF